jgi:RNA polymerase sigma-70 factor (ECF subfamily)
MNYLAATFDRRKSVMCACHPNRPEADQPDPQKARADWLHRSVVPHEKAVRESLRRWGVPADLIEDVVHDAYLRLLNAKCIADVRNSKSYFSISARSVVVSQARRLRCVIEEPHDPDHFSSLPSVEPTGEQAFDARRKLAEVQKVYESLDARTRNVVFLRRIERLTSRETAARLAISASAVEKHLGSAMKRLKAACANWPGRSSEERDRRRDA